MIDDMLQCTDFPIKVQMAEGFDRYFSGGAIADAFEGRAGFRKFWEENSDQIIIPYLGPHFIDPDFPDEPSISM